MIEVITGPMYSGKTEELIRRLTRSKIGGKKVIAYKPKIDNRYGEEVLASHSGIKIECRQLHEKFEDAMYFPLGYDVVGIDEAQFFSSELLSFVSLLDRVGVKVIVAGLDMTFRKEPFGCIPTLMAVASEVVKLKAVCHVCGDDAMYTQRLVGNKPASFSEPTVVVGAFDTYEARCFHCFETG